MLSQFFLLLGINFSAYLIGALPTGYWLCVWWAGVDITTHGSGNIGATNVGRLLGKPFFIMVFLIDAGKAYGYLWLLQKFLLHTTSLSLPVEWVCVLSAGMLVMGNGYSVFMRFKGGKGVATTLGILAFFLPCAVVVVGMIGWVSVMALTRHAFIASLLVISGVLGYLLVDQAFSASATTALGCFLWIWLWWRHKENLLHFWRKIKMGRRSLL